MQLIDSLLYCYLLLKPFYFFDSGTIQVCDVLLIIAFVLRFLDLLKNRKSEKWFKKNKLYLLFLLFVIAINTFWFFMTNDYRMMLCTSFYIFNLFVIILFSDKVYDLKFLKNMRNCLFVDLVGQLFFFITGVGKYEYVVSRYKGTFNDPNQFAFFCLTSFFLIYLINNKKEIKNNKLVLFSYAIAVFLIFESASTGMLLGLAIFTLFFILYKLFSFLKRRASKKALQRGVVIASAIIIIVAILCMTGIIDVSGIMDSISHSDIFERLIGKINIGESSQNGSGLLYDRGYDKIIKHPVYILFGAGEGGFDRFPDCVNNEIHGTLPGLLFYYGIIPTIFLTVWIYRNIKHIPKELYGLYLALFIESFTLLNQRQAFFWIIILFAQIVVSDNKGTRR